MEEDRTPVGRLDFKSSEGRTTSLVGSTPTLFRQSSPKTERHTPEKRRAWAALAMHVLVEHVNEEIDVSP